MGYKNIFTTYDSVDPPIWIEQEEQPSPTIIENPLYGLLDKVQTHIDSPEKPTSKKDSEESLWNKYEVKKDKPSSNAKSFKSFTGTQKDFINTMKPLYEKILQEQGLDTNYADYLVAQSALESNWGKNQAGEFNLGGIKLPAKQKGKGLGTVRKTREVIKGKDMYIEDEFRNFKDLEDYARFHVRLLNNMNYQAFKGDFINNVVRGGYATDPKYKQILQDVYDQIKANYG